MHMYTPTDYSLVHPSVLTQNKRRVSRQIITCIKAVVPHMQLSKARLLDVGTSNGIIAYHLAQTVKHVIGVDTDRTAISLAKKRFKRKNLQFKVYDGTLLSFPKNTFDIVIFRRVYSYVPNIERMMLSMYSALKPGGIVYFEGHNKTALLEPDYRIPFLHLLPAALHSRILSFFGYNRIYFGHYLTYNGLRSLFRKFQIVHLTPRIIQNPKVFNFVKQAHFQAITSRIPLRVYELFEPLFPVIIWILRE